MATTPKERFDAAVQVIHSLPKDGPFQPSYDMMLTFYGLYKQATEGKCTKPKPWSWDIVAKKKWDAWSKLGSMPAEEAMDLYVDELKKSIAMSTDKWKSMGEKDKRIVEAMPQEKPVRDFMDTIGTFYEIIEEKSPFEEERNKYSRMNGESMGHVIEVNGNGDMNHSLLVDPMLKNIVKQDVKINGIPHRIADDEFREDTQEKSALSILDSERDNWEQISSQQHSEYQGINGAVNSFHDNNEQTEIEDLASQIQIHNRESSDTVYDNIQHASNDEVAETERLTSDNPAINDKVTSESESDDEFCDTSDQPSPEDIMKTSKDQQMSTPLKGSDNRRTKNRVHFNDNPLVRTDVEMIQQTLSPIPQRLQPRHDISMSRNFPFGLGVSEHSPHDSMIVHGPTQDSLNFTGLSELGNSLDNSNSSAQSNGLTNTDVLEERVYSENLRTRGGGQLSPPGGSSRGNVQSQESYSAQGFRSDQGFGYYDGLPVPRGQGSGGGGEGRDPRYPPQSFGSVNEQIAITLLRLQQDMHTVLQRLDSLEAATRHRKPTSNWWPFPNLTGRSFLFVIIWPIFVHWFLSRLFRRRRTR